MGKKRNLQDTRTYCMVLYPDNSSHESFVSCLDFYECSYAYILHDRDLDENGKLKKHHYHLIIRYRNTRSLSALSKQFGIDERHFQPCRNFRGAVRYLRHFDDPDKVPYEMSEIKSNFDLSPYFGEKLSEVEQSKILLDYILKTEYVSLSQLLQFALQNDCFSAYRRGYSMYKDILFSLRPSQEDKFRR